MGSYYYTQLPASQQYLYNLLLVPIGQPQIPCRAMPQDIHAAIKALLMDHPELCFFEGKWRYENSIIYPQYVLPPTAMQELSATAAHISQTLSGEDYPRQVYEWMLFHVQYHLCAPNSQNAYGPLRQGQGLCKGIAKAYQLMMEQRKIRCILVEGTLDGRTKHVWNMINLHDQWLHVDVTMGYPCFWPLTASSDIYGGYLRTTPEISKSHRLYHQETLPTERYGGICHGNYSL